jgi:hypothetical protein
MDAIIHALDTNLEGATLACARINRRGDLVYSKPCEECRNMLSHYGIEFMVYSTTKGIIKEKII